MVEHPQTAPLDAAVCHDNPEGSPADLQIGLVESGSSVGSRQVEHLYRQVRGARHLAIAGEQRCTEVFGEDHVDGVVDDEIVAVAPCLREQWCAAGHRGGKSEKPVERAGGPWLIDESRQQHATQCAGRFDVEVIGHPPRSVARSERQETATERGASDDLRAGRSVKHDGVHD